MKKIVFLILLFTARTAVFAQNDEEPIIVVGKTLQGMVIDGESVRKVTGDVVLTQGDVTITCDTAVQFLSRNDAELIGNVIATQNNLRILTDKGYYYGNAKKVSSDEGVTLYDGKVVLSAIKGDYYFDEDFAYFRDDVELFDSTNTLLCDSMTYYTNIEKAVAVGKVVLYDSTNKITCDSLIHFRVEKITYAIKNVELTNSENSVIIYGDYMEDYYFEKRSFITGEPLLVQIDSSGADTLIIASDRMEAFKDSLRMFVAIDSVRIVRGEFSSRNDSTLYVHSKGDLYTIIKNNKVPRIWHGLSQLYGDTINAKIEEGNIKIIEARHNSFVLSRPENYPSRFDQISGERLIMYFDSSEIKVVEVEDNVLGIYFLYEQELPNGAIKASSNYAKIFFEERKVSDVMLYKTPESEYYPENLVEGAEYSFTLPLFAVRIDYPSKEELLKNKHLHKNQLMIYEPEFDSEE